MKADDGGQDHLVWSWPRNLLPTLRDSSHEKSWYKSTDSATQNTVSRSNALTIWISPHYWWIGIILSPLPSSSSNFSAEFSLQCLCHEHATPEHRHHRPSSGTPACRIRNFFSAQSRLFWRWTLVGWMVWIVWLFIDWLIGWFGVVCWSRFFLIWKKEKSIVWLLVDKSSSFSPLPSPLQNSYSSTCAHPRQFFIDWCFKRRDSSWLRYRWVDLNVLRFFYCSVDWILGCFGVVGLLVG